MKLIWGSDVGDSLYPRGSLCRPQRRERPPVRQSDPGRQLGRGLVNGVSAGVPTERGRFETACGDGGELAKVAARKSIRRHDFRFGGKRLERLKPGALSQVFGV
eukprot:CAMPEP_0180047292 /NCGR_PEP_ID=MMETSP0984-20121128/37674_1 /TAXON_ID=483367 /ORGANISM="non described non described, Strain CCMP 2436" /LENGTH=103 /DNA_ID=CAMNT_0021976107 /DNA_START=345 /DNA_END=656 /DNA_ORIENTATION=+